MHRLETSALDLLGSMPELISKKTTAQSKKQIGKDGLAEIYTQKIKIEHQQKKLKDEEQQKQKEKKNIDKNNK